MAKDKPEVGDVWEHKSSNNKHIITFNSKLHSENVMAYVLFDGIHTYALEEYILKENYTYLGKSKVSIEDLFKTENEE